MSCLETFWMVVRFENMVEMSFGGSSWRSVMGCLNSLWSRARSRE